MDFKEMAFGWALPSGESFLWLNSKAVPNEMLPLGELVGLVID